MINFIDNNALIFEAARLGNIDMLYELFWSGADIHARNSQQQTPLHLAVLGLHREVIDFLLSEGADPDAADRNGVTPRSLAVFYDISAALILRTAILHSYSSSLPGSSSSSSSTDTVEDDEPVVSRKTERRGSHDRQEYTKRRR